MPPTAANDESILSGSLALKDSILRGAGYRDTPDTWQAVEHETFVWGKKGDLEFWDARPFIFLDKMMRPYLLSRLKNEAGSWEYTRYLAEANAVYSVSDPDLLKLLPRPEESDYRKDEPPTKLIESACDNETSMAKVAKKPSRPYEGEISNPRFNFGKVRLNRDPITTQAGTALGSLNASPVSIIWMRSVKRPKNSSNRLSKALDMQLNTTTLSMLQKRFTTDRRPTGACGD